MPFKSKAQARFMFAKHPKLAKEFAAATPSIKALPDHKSTKESSMKHEAKHEAKKEHHKEHKKEHHKKEHHKKEHAGKHEAHKSMHHHHAEMRNEGRSGSGK
jgi:hypothetical protein